MDRGTADLRLEANPGLGTDCSKRFLWPAAIKVCYQHRRVDHSRG
jgi:hypothetical protein